MSNLDWSYCQVRVVHGGHIVHGGRVTILCAAPHRTYRGPCGTERACACAVKHTHQERFRDNAAKICLFESSWIQGGFENGSLPGGECHEDGNSGEGARQTLRALNQFMHADVRGFVHMAPDTTGLVRGCNGLVRARAPHGKGAAGSGSANEGGESGQGEAGGGLGEAVLHYAGYVGPGSGGCCCDVEARLGEVCAGRACTFTWINTTTGGRVSSGAAGSDGSAPLASVPQRSPNSTVLRRTVHPPTHRLDPSTPAVPSMFAVARRVPLLLRLARAAVDVTPLTHTHTP